MSVIILPAQASRGDDPYGYRAEFIQPRWSHGQHITFLRFIAPDFARAHARRFSLHRAQIKYRTTVGIMRQLRQRIG